MTPLFYERHVDAGNSCPVFNACVARLDSYMFGLLNAF